MNEKQAQAIKNMNNDGLLRMYNSYYLQVTSQLIPDKETGDIFEALRLEILSRMAGRSDDNV